MVIADTGFWVALANRRDVFHGRARAALADLREPLISTWPVLTETCHLLVNRLDASAQLKFIASFAQGAFVAWGLDSAHAPRLHTLMTGYADLPMDLADASLVLLAEHLGHGRILSTDRRDFNAYRWKEHEPFENLLLRY
ncbi:MAG: PIN domain-containing protein [Sulfuricella sp.]|nr:PIN domain-containing protein [Sulfuricella sp.]